RLERPDDSPLPALPPRRPRLLDLLRDVAAGGVALARRRSRPREEGALPAAARRLLDGRDAGRDVCGDAPDPDRALADLHSGGPGLRVALDSARCAVRRLRGGPLPDRRVPQRALPRRRARGPRRAAAALLPHAGALALRAAARPCATPPARARRAA